MKVIHRPFGVRPKFRLKNLRQRHREFDLFLSISSFLSDSSFIYLFVFFFSIVHVSTFLSQFLAWLDRQVIYKTISVFFHLIHKKRRKNRDNGWRRLLQCEGVEMNGNEQLKSPDQYQLIKKVLENENLNLAAPKDSLRLRNWNKLLL